MEAKAAKSAPWPWAMPRKVEKSTMTKMSSQEAPAITIWGMPCFVPQPSSIRRTMRGTTTAGETAAIIAPITAASARERPSSTGASST